LAETASRAALEDALALYSAPERQGAIRSFLDALSVNELLFLAEFLGSCVLLTSAISMDTWEAICHSVRASHRRLAHLDAGRRRDAEHNLILVMEFAARCLTGSQ
jgi:hypothetical protein